MLKLIFLVTGILALSRAPIDISFVDAYKDYLIAGLLTVLVMPWIVDQLD